MPPSIVTPDKPIAPAVASKKRLSIGMLFGMIALLAVFGDLGFVAAQNLPILVQVPAAAAPTLPTETANSAVVASVMAGRSSESVNAGV